MIYDERSLGFVQASMKKRVDGNGAGLLSALQLKSGLKKKEPTFLATLVTEEDDVEGEIPSVVHDLLRRYEDVMPDQLPKHLPPRRAVDHRIELVPGAKPPAHTPYKMSLL